MVTRAGESASRLVVRVIVRRGRRSGLLASLRGLAPWLDLVMMRKQLLTLKRLAEDQALNERG